MVMTIHVHNVHTDLPTTHLLRLGGSISVVSMVRLTGKIFREEGMFVAELSEIGQSTWSDSLSGVMADVPRLALEYFHGLRDLGVLAEKLASMGVKFDGGAFNVNIHVQIRDDVLPALPEGASTSIDSNVSVPVAA